MNYLWVLLFEKRLISKVDEQLHVKLTTSLVFNWKTKRLKMMLFISKAYFSLSRSTIF